MFFTSQLLRSNALCAVFFSVIAREDEGRAKQSHEIASPIGRNDTSECDLCPVSGALCRSLFLLFQNDGLYGNNLPVTHYFFSNNVLYFILSILCEQLTFGENIKPNDRRDC